MPDTNRLGKDDLGLGQAAGGLTAGLFYIFMDNILQGIQEALLYFSISGLTSIWKIRGWTRK